MTIQRCTLHKLSSSDGQTIIPYIMSAPSRTCVTSRSTSWRRSQEYDGLFALDDGTSCPNVFSPYFRKSSTKFQIRQKYKDVTKYAFHYFWCNLSVTHARSDVHRQTRDLESRTLKNRAASRRSGDGDDHWSSTRKASTRTKNQWSYIDWLFDVFWTTQLLESLGTLFHLSSSQERWINLLVMSRTRCTRTPFPTPVNFWRVQKMNSCIVLSVGERWRNADSTAIRHWIFWLRLTLLRITILVNTDTWKRRKKNTTVRVHTHSQWRDIRFSFRYNDFAQ